MRLCPSTPGGWAMWPATSSRRRTISACRWLLYQRGYFRQEIDVHGIQQALYPFNDTLQLPIRPVREPNGEWLRLSVTLPGLKMWIRAWQVQVGRCTLYLLDANDPANPPVYRGITSELYGGGPDVRIRQEAMLSIGGWRLLRAISIAGSSLCLRRLRAPLHNWQTSPLISVPRPLPAH